MKTNKCNGLLFLLAASLIISTPTHAGVGDLISGIFRRITGQEDREVKQCEELRKLGKALASSGQIVLSDLRTDSFKPLRISGRLHNRSSDDLSAIALMVRVEDCINGRCDTIFNEYLSGGVNAGKGIAADFVIPTGNQLLMKSVNLRGTPRVTTSLTYVEVSREMTRICEYRELGIR